MSTVTKAQAIEILNDKIKAIKEEGSEDTGAWEYRADLLRALDRINAGHSPQDELENV